MGGIPQCLVRVNDWWEAIQVELHGQYSIARLTALRQYSERTILLRAIGVAVLAPVPCLAIIIAMDTLPLASPYAGLDEQTFGFWFRTYFTCWLLTFMSITLMCQVIPELPMSTRRLWCFALVIPALLILVAYGYTLIIGFPVPFAIQMDTGPWLAMLGAALWVSWKDILRNNRKIRDDLVRYLKVFQAQVVIILVYTAYNVTFTLIGRSYQTAFSILLPAIKMMFKNWVSSGLVHLEDLAPTIIVFNVDVFHALYVSLTMQQSLTPGSMIVVMTVDVAQSMIAYYEIHKVLQRVHASAYKLARAGVRLTGQSDVASMDVLQLAAEILEGNQRVREHPDIANARHIAGVRRRSSVRRSWNRKYFGDRRSQIVSRGNANPAKVLPSPRALPGRTVAAPPEGLATSAAAVSPWTPQAASLTKLERWQLECVQDVLKLLHMTEFYVLIEFAEVMMATLYAVYLSVLSHLPNRIYYTQLSRLSDEEMRMVAGRVSMYAFLELVSYIVLCFALSHKLKNLSPTRQLAFALRSHWKIVLSTFAVWTFVTVQFALEHYGADYTFQFKWLRKAQPATPPL